MKNELLEKCRSGDKALGVWSNLPDVHMAETMARSGADWICFDLQHGLMDYTQLTNLLPAVTGTAITPLVRVAANTTDQIGKALDVGAQGVIVPMVNSADDAQAAVSACFYPPRGERSCGPMRGAMLEGLSYLASANEETACLLMIETQEGLKNLDAIAAVPGVTGLFIGPMDLTYGLGLAPGSFDDERFKAALKSIRDACRQQGLLCGLFGYDASMAAQGLGDGFDFVSVGSDISFARDGVGRALAVATGSAQDAQSRGGY